MSPTHIDSSLLAQASAAPAAEPFAAPDVFPLSLTQESVWLVEQMFPGTSAYNLAEAWRLEGALELAALQRSIESLGARHETLRTVFGMCGERLVQIIQPDLATFLEIVDLSGAQDKEGELQRTLGVEARRPFDLRRGSLARFCLYRLGEREHVLLLNLHHLISDEWSFGVLLSEIAAQYASRTIGSALALPQLSIQYADFATWQREQYAAHALDGQLQYWRDKLRRPIPPMALPTDRPRPATRQFRGATQFFQLPKTMAESLKELSRAQGVTLFMTMLAGFQTLLHRYTREQDIIVGSPMAGRERMETEGLIGFFVNTHALRTDFSGNPTFIELLARVREVVLEACAHQEVSLDKVVEVLKPERFPDRHPLFETVFGLQPGASEHWALPGLSASRIELENGASKFELSVLVTENREGLRVRCEYREDLFEAETIARLMRHFTTLLNAAIAQPGSRISELPLLEQIERDRMVEAWNPAPTESPRHRSISEYFEEQAAQRPEAVAVVCADQRLSYGELNSEANRLAHYLQRIGVGPEVPVALCLERSLEMIVAILAVLKSGGVYVPMDPACPQERLSFMLEDTCAPVVVTQATLRVTLPHTQATVLCLDAEATALSSQPSGNLAATATAENTAYIIYTSGSTGKPKGVQVSHQNVVRLFKQTESWFGFNSSDVWSLFHSYTFDFTVWELWGALLYGGKLVVVPYLVARSPGEFYELLAREKVTVLNQTPSAFRQLIWAEQSARTPLKLDLRYIICGGEALELQSLMPWFDRHGDDCPRVVNMYGITETTVHVTYRPIRRADVTQGLGSVIGVPIPDLRLYLLDENLQPVPPGVPGEICVAGDGVARGYLNRPELTAQRFVADPFGGVSGAKLYHSGDLGRWSSAGELEYLGRIDHQVKIRGFRVELGEIESALNQHPSLRESVVLAQDTLGDKRLIAYVVPLREAPTSEELRAHLGKRLPDYMVPALFVPLKSLPLTSNGKVDRRALPAPESEAFASATPEVPPRNGTEEMVAAVWCEVLKRPSVGIHHNFFHLGGHSLLATQVMSRLSAALNIELSVRILFEAPTIASLAEAIDRARSEQPASEKAIPKRVHGSRARELLTHLEQLTPEQIEEFLAESDDRTFPA